MTDRSINRIDLNRLEDKEINPHTYVHLIFDNEVKTIQWKKKASSTNSAGLFGSLQVECKLIHFFLLVQI